MTEEEKKQRERRMAILAEFTLMDDVFMSEVLDGQNEIVGLILRIILKRDDLKVTSVETQREYKSHTMRSIRLDVKAVDATGKIYDIEIQRSDRGTGARRARFYSSMIDRELLEKSRDFDELVDTYVIFITEKDRFGKGLPLYHIERRIAELENEPFGDGTHIIYVNGEYREKDSLGKLMHDFTCKRAGDMYFETIAERVKYFKEEEGGHGHMNRLWEELIEEERAKAAKEAKAAAEAAAKVAVAKAEHDNAVDFAKTLLEMNKLSYGEIAKASKLTLEEVKAISSGKTA